MTPPVRGTGREAIRARDNLQAGAARAPTFFPFPSSERGQPSALAPIPIAHRQRYPCARIEHNIPCLFVLAQPEERRVPDEPVSRPLGEPHFRHELRLLQARHVKDPAPWVERYRRANVGPTPPPCFRKTTQHPLRSQTSPENLQIFLRGSEQLRRLRALPANKSRITSGAAFSGW